MLHQVGRPLAADRTPLIGYGRVMASPEAKFAPVGALRGGLALMVLGGLMAWDPVDSIPDWAWIGTLSIGALLLAVALGIRTLRT